MIELALAAEPLSNLFLFLRQSTTCQSADKSDIIPA
jgi:hypothetical protein